MTNRRHIKTDDNNLTISNSIKILPLPTSLSLHLSLSPSLRSLSLSHTHTIVHWSRHAVYLLVALIRGKCDGFHQLDIIVFYYSHFSNIA